MLSDPIQVCSCEADKLNCYIPSKMVIIIPEIDINISLVSVGIKNGLTEDVITLYLLCKIL